MTGTKSPRRWAIELTQVLNAALGPDRCPFDVAALRWLEYTEKRAVLVVSRDGYMLWSRASDPAWKTGAFFRTSGPPVPIPDCSLAAQGRAGAGRCARTRQSPGVWFRNEEARELIVFSEQYDFVISLLVLADHAPLYQVDEDPIEDAFDRLGD